MASPSNYVKGARTMVEMAGTTGLEPAASAVTGHLSFLEGKDKDQIAYRLEIPGS